MVLTGSEHDATPGRQRAGEVPARVGAATAAAYVAVACGGLDEDGALAYSTSVWAVAAWRRGESDRVSDCECECVTEEYIFVGAPRVLVGLGQIHVHGSWVFR
jgi:hypothetical protein